jgi:hypothetical protein
MQGSAPLEGNKRADENRHDNDYFNQAYLGFVSTALDGNRVYEYSLKNIVAFLS